MSFLELRQPDHPLFIASAATQILGRRAGWQLSALNRVNDSPSKSHSRTDDGRRAGHVQKTRVNLLNETFDRRSSAG
jgi:hypothetical protein